MREYKKILVAMDLDEGDVSAINFAAKISRMSESEEIHFYHVAEDLEIPEKLCSAISVTGETCDTIIGLMSDAVEKNWDGPASAKLAYDASDGDMLKDVLAYIKQKDIDLVIVQKTCERSKVPERLARKAPCSVIMVSPGSEPSFKEIFVAVDFSDYSQKALEKAIRFAKAAGSEKVTCVHVYSVPIGYHKSGHSHDEFSDILKKNAREQFDKMLEKLDTQGISVEFIVQMNEQPHLGIADIVHENGADLLVVGSRGRSKSAAILLGSVTERLVEVCKIPVFTWKKKGQGLALLEVMFNM